MLFCKEYFLVRICRYECLILSVLQVAGVRFVSEFD